MVILLSETIFGHPATPLVYLIELPVVDPNAKAWVAPGGIVTFKFNGTYVRAGAAPAEIALLIPNDTHPGGSEVKLAGITQFNGVVLYITVIGILVPAAKVDLNEKLLIVTGNADVFTISKPTRLDPLLSTKLVANESVVGVAPRALLAN